MSVFSNDFALADNESRETMIRLRSEMMKAMDELPANEKAAYMEAMKHAPEVVEKETNPVRFLRVDDYDVKAAAARLACYWDNRLELFGERAHLPLDDLTGNGALVEDDIALIKAGNIAKLPDSPEGHPVVVSDITQLNKTASTQIATVKIHRLRMAFFWNTKLSMDYIKVQTEGLIALRVITTTIFDADHFKKAHRLIEKSSPCKFYRYHFCCLPPARERSLFLKTVVPIMAKMLGKKYDGRLHVHVGKCKADFLKPLRKFGFQSCSLPPSLGGTWSYGKYQEWILAEQWKTTSSSEEETEDAKPAAQTATAKAVCSADGEDALNCLALAASDKAREADRKARKRQMDVMYARGRRQREKRELDELQRQCIILNGEKDGLENEFLRLQRLLAEAESIVSEHHSAKNQRPRTANNVDALRQLQSTALYQHAHGQDALVNYRETVRGVSDATTQTKDHPADVHRLQQLALRRLLEELEAERSIRLAQHIEAERSRRMAEAALLEGVIIEKLNLLRRQSQLNLAGDFDAAHRSIADTRQAQFSTIETLLHEATLLGLRPGLQVHHVAARGGSETRPCEHVIGQHGPQAQGPPTASGVGELKSGQLVEYLL